ncbi:MAG TPA: CDP-diacylglycerol--glycerol-3-phosphate 3-phosphatidyltransferase [Acidimicrobiales bacterium]|nr:CDP-diacylglycerol--glycerol-3-phosphate 3-phosphatidyltransferase [Acidimicrobiales bacterium]
MATESARRPAPRRGFGPSALITPANAVTVVRVLVTPVLIAMILGGGSSWPAIAFWIALCATDWVDGYLARRQGTTRSGAFLDPLADKFMILGAMFALVAEEVFWWVPVALITARELVISLYRVWMGRQGVSVPARWWAKVKTVVQQVAVGLALLPLTDDQPAVANLCLWAAVGLALVSGAQYLLDGNRAARAV